MDIVEMFENNEQKYLLESLERLRNASQTTAEEVMLRSIRESTTITDDSHFSPPTEILLICLYSVLAIIGFVLNMFTSCVILFSKKLMRNPSNLLVLNLMTSDLLMVIFCVPFTLMSLIWKTWMFGQVMCKLIPFLQSVSIIVCSATIAIIAIDRLIRVTQNISTNSYHVMFARTHWIMISVETVSIWVFAIIISSPIAFFQVLITMSVKSALIFSKCMEIWPQGAYKGMYAVTNMMIQFLLPTVILIYTNIRIKRHLEQNLSGLDTRTGMREILVSVQCPPDSPSSMNTSNQSSSRIPSFSFSRLFGCHLRVDTQVRTNLNTSGSLAAEIVIDTEGGRGSNNNQSNRSKRSSSGQNSETLNRNRSLLMKEIRRNQQVTRTLFSIVLSFTITWLPWNLFNVYLDFDRDFNLPVESTYLILAFCYLIAMTTIPVNACMYGWANPAIRSEALALLGLIKRTIADQAETVAVRPTQRETHLDAPRMRTAASYDFSRNASRPPIRSSST